MMERSCRLIMRTEKILGVEILSTDYKHFMESISEDIEMNRKKVIVAVNPEKIMKMREDAQLDDFVKKADYRIPDGTGILLASKKMGGNIKNRITGVDTMMELAKLASEKNYSIFLLGSRDEIVEKTKDTLISRFPGLRIAGVRNGYDLNDEVVVRKINNSGAQILFIAMGSPKQELWMDKNKDDLNVNIFQGVGGSFDVIGGFIKRAPSWMQKIGLEWLHRLILEPKRIFRQMNLVRFLRLISKETKK
jgi:N-acetylglucosaminyldiphosphoundecaprenol N-acetyl-beta-D-mannosaminyltransferase